ncbi:PRD domain-containing protein [Alicyclobacillus sp.]|uniref:PRD domain-containing protein n=1 Tax=Alicyclobacillus sp. TaxID=61169 RepID=UPI0025BACD87|nr:PRD domain-containing protein [Alicyclobacillus sp.]MCL6516471.1 PRD domain-containing protein [Alicyclobacillus sp.]
MAYQVKRALNNNVVVVRPEAGEREEIWVGRGIGFGVRPGLPLMADDPRVEQRFVLANEEHRTRFRQLFTVVDPVVIGLAEEIIARAERALGQALHEHIHVALADHIGFALERLRGGLEVDNPFVEELEALYPRHWAVAEDAAALIEDRFGIPIPRSEIGFLTLHLHAASQEGGLRTSVRVADGVKAALDATEANLGHALERSSLDHQRLVTHLRFAIQRGLRREQADNPLKEAIRERLPESHRAAVAAAKAVAERIQVELPEDEVAYLALHIERIRRRG